MKKKLSIGVENFKKMIDNDCYFVDKTLFIRDIIDKHAEVTLFTRPRRFGKTLAMSMIQTFFEKGYDRKGNLIDNSRYFEGLKIMDAGDEYTSYMGKYPVIFLSLKAGKQATYELSYKKLAEVVAKEFDRHSYILDGDALNDAEKEKFIAIRDEKADEAAYLTSLAFLSNCLEKFHEKKVIILIDEYDVPLENAHFSGFYNEMISFIRSLFESALKTNDSLEFALMTGCLRVSKESIFHRRFLEKSGADWKSAKSLRESCAPNQDLGSTSTGLNNPQMVSVLNNSYAEYFGFTEPEVKKMLEFYNISDRFNTVKKWYDGYLFGQTEVYNPWSMISFVNDAVNEGLSRPKAYWSNTSSNDIVRSLIEHADASTKSTVEELIDGGAIVMDVHEEVTYDDINFDDSAKFDINNLWNFLLFTGYLKVAESDSGHNAVKNDFGCDVADDSSEIFDDTSGDNEEDETEFKLNLAIPNLEVKTIYKNSITKWFKQKIKLADFTLMYKAMFNKDFQTLEDEIQRILAQSISYNDSIEAFYHGMMLGIMRGLDEYDVLSNRESGHGRPDLLIRPFIRRMPAIIMEFKYVKTFKDIDAGCDEALKQIEDQHYVDGLREEGYENIIKYGICFCKKSCKVKLGE